ncbi:MAG: hypothetical protein N2C13_00880 [Chloroflexota bacterium]
MSFQKTGRKLRPDSNKTFPKSSVKIETAINGTFVTEISDALHRAFGGSGKSIKTIMKYTGAGERTVKNWFEAKNGPNGKNLIKLAQHSDEVLETILMLAGRDNILAGKLLVDARDKLVEMIKIIEYLSEKCQPNAKD